MTRTEFTIDPAMLPAHSFPPSGEVVVITRFDEALEVLRSRKLKPGTLSRSVHVALAPGDTMRARVVATVPFADASSDPGLTSYELLLRGGDLSHTEGALHTQRRKALSPLFGRNAHIWFRDKVILPGLRRNLSQVLANTSDATVRTDMIPFARKVFVQAAAALVGFDGTQDDVGADALVALNRKIEGNRDLAQVLPNGPEVRDVIQQSLDGRAELYERFYVPSLEARRHLVSRVRAGDLAEDDLPHDLLTLFASGAAPFGEDPQVGLPIAMSFLTGSTGTNTQVLVRVLKSLEEWFAEHPQDEALRTDPSFLEAALNETIRLQGNGLAATSRVAVDDVTLSTGTHIRAGQYVALMKDAVNRDERVFGPDAGQFNPRRVVPAGAYPFGLGFASGSHMCIGLPLVLGQGGVSGMQVPVLQALYGERVRPDPGNPPQKRLELLPYRDEYASFPVIFHRG